MPPASPSRLSACPLPWFPSPRKRTPKNSLQPEPEGKRACAQEGGQAIAFREGGAEDAAACQRSKKGLAELFARPAIAPLAAYFFKPVCSCMLLNYRLFTFDNKPLRASPSAHLRSEYLPLRTPETHAWDFPSASPISAWDIPDAWSLSMISFQSMAPLLQKGLPLVKLDTKINYHKSY